MWIITDGSLINLELASQVVVIDTIEGIQTRIDLVNSSVVIKGNQIEKITNAMQNPNRKYLDLRGARQ